MVSSSDWENMKRWVKERIGPLGITTARASGGNIHKILSLSGNKKAGKMSLNQMRKVRKILKSYNLIERITLLGLKPDRADVILPALKIYFLIMKWSNIKTYIVPQMGLADGIIRQLYLSNPK
jgi:exopolyphosphatase/guanosine-5'-triphosphate,3'-diphosphate pyrophosphatase